MKKRLCEECNSSNLKARLATYPIKIGEKQINVERVSVRECLDCHALIPTEKGDEKIKRCMMSIIDIMMHHGVDPFNSV